VTPALRREVIEDSDMTSCVGARTGAVSG
jgi:hypothetical protein